MGHLLDELGTFYQNVQGRVNRMPYHQKRLIRKLEELLSECQETEVERDELTRDLESVEETLGAEEFFGDRAEAESTQFDIEYELQELEDKRRALQFKAQEWLTRWLTSVGMAAPRTNWVEENCCTPDSASSPPTMEGCRTTAEQSRQRPPAAPATPSGWPRPRCSRRPRSR